MTFRDRAIRLQPGDWASQRDLLIDLCAAVDKITVAPGPSLEAPLASGDGGTNDQE